MPFLYVRPIRMRALALGGQLSPRSKVELLGSSLRGQACHPRTVPARLLRIGVALEAAVFAVKVLA